MRIHTLRDTIASEADLPHVLPNGMSVEQGTDEITQAIDNMLNNMTNLGIPRPE